MRELCSRFMEKSKVLYKEASDDLKCGNYNKSVSGFYFSTEALANALLCLLGQRVRGFMGRINTIAKLVSREVGKKMLYLYELRVLADHKETLLKEKDALEAKEIADFVLRKINEFISKRW